MDLIRQILLEIEQQGSYVNWFDVDVEAYSPEQMDYHLELLMEAGLIAARAFERELRRLYPVRLTWEGHEFLDAALDEARWEKAQEIMAGAGAFTYEILKQVLLRLAEEQIETRMAGPG
jgi:DNA-binding MarR family transcriptional regulator